MSQLERNSQNNFDKSNNLSKIQEEAQQAWSDGLTRQGNDRT